MKQLFTLLIALVAAATASAGSVITAVSSGNWTTASNWNLNRVPANDDTIIIPASKNIQITTDENFNNLILDIWGTLDLTNSGKLTLNNASLIRVYTGGIIVGQGNGNQIRIGNTHVFKGDWPDVTGPSFANNTTGGGFAPMQMLPVTFVNFYVANDNETVRISWSTATEKNNSHFEIQRSTEGVNWTTIAVIAAVGNSTSLNHYSYSDKKINAAVTYYRIKQIDEDATTTYTAVKSISGTKSSSTEITVKSNNDIAISFSTIQSKVRVNIWSMNGQPMQQQSFTQSANVSIRPRNAVPGVYVVQVIDGNNNSESRKIKLH